MENFIVSARKYRPVTFDSVVGQAAITGTLKNSIRNNHLGQAFLFCGPRGVGKTTCARILAKTINCENLTSNLDPCNACDSCVSFNENSSFNIYELDAASNNSVEDIRNLVEQVRILPHKGKYKVYIIDEVHMLSANAFNAFLKTLEEPPHYAIFILATTEKHKILPTILSRCQIYDFNRITSEDIAKHLEFVAGKENVEAEPEALHVIAQKADGALRDALSIFDQVVSYAGNKVTHKQVMENLNVLDTDYYFQITDYIAAGDISSCLLLLNDIMKKGFDGHHFIGGLSSHFRDLLMSRNPSTVVLLDASAQTKEKYKTKAAQLHPAHVMEWLNIAGRCDLSYKASRNPRLLVEMSLMKMCVLENQNALPGSTGAEKKNDTRSVTTSIPAPVPEPSRKSSTPSAPLNPEQSRKAESSSPPRNPEQSVSNQTLKTDHSEKVDIKKATEPASNSTDERAQTFIKANTPEKKNIPRTTSIRLTDLSGNGNKEVDTTVRVTGEDPFTEEQIIAAWNEFTGNAREQGKRSLFATLSSRQPSLKENHVVEFEVDNIANTSNVKTEITEFLRKKLNNHLLSLNILVKKVQEENVIPYSTSEKFKKMAEKNPNLNLLKDQFDLEIDF